MRSGDWMRGNLAAQGYCLSAADGSARRIGLRFSTGLCLSLVVVALVLESSAMVIVGALFAAGAATVALVLGGLRERHTNRKELVAS